MKSYTINLIRHGMTEANLSGAYAGATDIPICDEGKKKLLDLREKHDYPKAEIYLSSPLKRCVQTCEVLYPGVKPQIIDGLKEWNFGRWEGKTPAELLEDKEYSEWIKSGRQGTIPSGESAQDFGKRICECFESIVYSMISQGVSSANIFTHGGVIMSILATYGIPRADFFDWIVDNGCGYSIRIMPSLWMRDRVAEVFGKVPEGAENKISGKFKDLIESK